MRYQSEKGPRLTKGSSMEWCLEIEHLEMKLRAVTKEPLVTFSWTSSVEMQTYTDSLGFEG